MTPQEKAKELVELFWTEVEDNDCSTRKMSFSQAKQCALIAVDEIINHHSQEQGLYRIDTYYWLQVKSELQSL